MGASSPPLSCVVRLVRYFCDTWIPVDRYQDPEQGGFGDRPGNVVDVFHTHFSIAGLSLLKFDGIKEVDPV